MKLFILKLMSLVVLCLGVISLAFAMGISEVTGYVAQIPDQIAQFRDNLPANFDWAKGLLELKILWLVGSIAAIVLGIYGFFPRFSKWKKPKKITYDGPHGQVQIQLDTVEQSLNNVLARMPEVKKIDVTVEPREGGRSALIKANAVLQHQPGQNARAIAGLVSDYIAETATKMLGLEELATIELNVIGINVNSRKSSKAIRKESLSHSGNAPVELLEAAPKPMALAAPGGPLGSGPIEEEMEEEDGDGTMEANAVDSAEEESKQAAARSELLEPLHLHNPHAGENAVDGGADAQDTTETAENDAESDETPADDEEDVPSIVEASVPGDRLNASVVPEPLGDFSGDDDDADVDDDADDVDDAEDLDDADDDNDIDSVDIPEAVEANVPEDDGVVEAPEPPASPWGTIESSDVTDGEADTTASEDIDTSFSARDDGIPSVDGATDEIEDNGGAAEDGDGEVVERATESNFFENQTTDSIMGDIDGDDEGDDELTDPDEVEPELEGDEPAGGEEKKKGWGWFN